MADLSSPPTHVRISGIRRPQPSVQAGLDMTRATIDPPPPPPLVSALLRALTKATRPAVFRRDTGSSTTTEGSFSSEARSFESLLPRASSVSSASSVATSISDSHVKSHAEYVATGPPDSFHVDCESSDSYNADADTESRSPSPGQRAEVENTYIQVEQLAVAADDAASHSGSDHSSYCSALFVAEYVLSPEPVEPSHHRASDVDEFGVLLFPGARPPFSPDELKQQAAQDQMEEARVPASKIFSFLHRKKPIKTIAAAKHPTFQSLQHTSPAQNVITDCYESADTHAQATQAQHQPPSVTFAVSTGRGGHRLTRSPFPFLPSESHPVEPVSAWSDDSDSDDDLKTSQPETDEQPGRQPASKVFSFLNTYSQSTKFNEASIPAWSSTVPAISTGAFQFASGSFARKPSTTITFDGLIACPRPRRIENIGPPAWCTLSGSFSIVAQAELCPQLEIEAQGGAYVWLPAAAAYDHKPRYVDYLESSAFAPREPCTLLDCQCAYLKSSPEEDALRHICVLNAGRTFLRVINNGALEVIENWERILHAPDTSVEIALTLAEKMVVVCELFTRDSQLFRQSLERSLRGTFLRLARWVTQEIYKSHRGNSNEQRLVSAQMVRYSTVIHHLEARRVMQPM